MERNRSAIDTPLSLWHKKLCHTSWLQLSVRTGAADVRRHIELFDRARIAWRGSQEDTAWTLFLLISDDDAALRKDIVRFLKGSLTFLHSPGKPRVQWRIIKEENWQNSWKRFIKPRRRWPSFWVTPPWAEPPKFRRRQVITIEPGLAFGTGTHATTRGCMEFLEQVADRLRGVNSRGSMSALAREFLAIALTKLGREDIWAIDNDPVALTKWRAKICALTGLRQSSFVRKQT